MTRPHLPQRTCVAPPGRFIYGLHQPRYRVLNLRETQAIGPLGILENGDFVENGRNFPHHSLSVDIGEPVFEIPNPLPFRGTTFILKSWADAAALHHDRITLAPPPATSFSETCRAILGNPDDATLDRIFAGLPAAVQLAVATTSTDPEDLTRLAELTCEIVHGTRTGLAAGLKFNASADGRSRPVINNHPLFEALANNPHLPDDYKLVMVLRAGVQGGSEIVGETVKCGNLGHVYEYLRRNSYIPWGHYASNMADDTVRYRTTDLSMADIRGLRHLYYQRTYVRLAADLGLPLPPERETMPVKKLEMLREKIINILAEGGPAGELPFTATLWGWNYGFDFSPTLYRLHASHQQIHTQYAMLPAVVTQLDSHGNQGQADMPAYGCGDMVAEVVARYRAEHQRDFFADYLAAIRTNQRTDGNPAGEHSLVVHEDEQVILFVPKAQTSQWELQIMPLRPVGNILEADTAMRAALDRALLIAQKILAGLGARLVTSIEFPKRFDAPDTGQRLLYALLPKLPESPGAFSEAQLRWINGHYPEDFAAACRVKLPAVLRATAPD